MDGPLFSSAEEAACWAAELPEPALGRARFEYVASTSSTQDMAFAAAELGAPGGAVFAADQQTAGRGRQGAAWLAPAGSSLLFSVLLRPAPPSEDSGRAALSAALAVCRAAAKFCGVDPAVKWPNDLLLAGGKFGGILIESRGAAAGLGLGINVLQGPEDFPAELTGRATSLAAGLGEPPDRKWLLAMLLIELGALFGEAPEPWESVRLDVTRRLAWRGRAVRVAGTDLAGTLLGVDEVGQVVIERGDGQRLTAATGSLELDEDGPGT